MKKAQIDILHNVESIDPRHPILQTAPKTPQHRFLLTYLALHFLNNNQQIPILPNLLSHADGSFSQFLLQTKYMKKSMDKGALLENPKFSILKMLILWMAQVQKLQSNPKPNFLYSALLPHPQQLDLHQYEELIVYFNYIGGDILKILKKATDLDVDDILQLLQVLLPRVYYNVIISLQALGSQIDKTEDILFYNQSLDYVVRTNAIYRSLCKMSLKRLIGLTLKPNQMRQMVERACRYYLLFHKDHKNSTQMFLSAFQKATQAAKFSLTDQIVLFFKVINKLGDSHLEKAVRKKYQWVDKLLNRFGENSVVGHPRGEVNPFNSLGIKQKFYVGPGKASIKNIQIYNEYSLLYLKADIQSFDISIKMYYLGDFQSKVEVKKNILTQQKVSGFFNSAFIAAKKGIYMVEFDNTYSWIYGKNIKFQYVLLAQYKQEHREVPWIKNIFEIKDMKRQQEKPIEVNQQLVIGQECIKDKKTQSIVRQQLQAYHEQSEEQKSEQKQIPLIKQQIKTQQPMNQVSQQQINEDKRVQSSQKQVIQWKDQIQQSSNQYHQKQEVSQPIEAQEKESQKQRQQEVYSQKLEERRQMKQQIQHQEIQRQYHQVQFTQQEPIIPAQQYHQNIQKEEQITQAIQEEIIHKEIKEQIQKDSSETNQIKEQCKPQVLQIPSSNSISSQNIEQKVQWGQANLSLIDNIFSLLVNQLDHTYEFQTNLEDRIIKRLKSYCEGKDRLSWIFNSEARDWLKKHSFILQTKNGLTLLHTVEQGKARNS